MTCGTSVWSDCVGRQYGATVWDVSMERLCGTSGWSDCVGRQYEAVWDVSMERLCGMTVWDVSVGQVRRLFQT